MRAQMPPTEEGAAQWRQVCAYIDTPPPAVVRAASETPAGPVRRALPRGAPAGAPVTAEAQASAFAAYVGSGVGA